MSSESEIKKYNKIFLKKLLNKDSPKLPTKLAWHIFLKAQKEIEEFSKREKNEELDEELKLAQEIFVDQEYEKIVENSDLQDKIKKIILEHGPFTDSEIDPFVQENLNRPVLEEILNDFKGNEDIRNAMKKYGVTTIHPVISHQIFLEFFHVNENLIE